MLWLHWTWRKIGSQAIFAWCRTPLIGIHHSVVPHWPGWNFLRGALDSQFSSTLTFLFLLSKVSNPHHSLSLPIPNLSYVSQMFPSIHLLYFWFHFGSFLLDDTNQCKYLSVSLPPTCLLTIQYSSKATLDITFLCILPEYFIHTRAFHTFLFLFYFLFLLFILFFWSVLSFS